MKKETAIYIGATLRRLRKATGKAQEKLALDSKLDRSYISELERNIKSPSIGTLFKLAKGLEMELEELVKEIRLDTDFNSIFEKEDY